MAYPTAAQVAPALLYPDRYWSSSNITFGFPTTGGQWDGYAANSEPTNANFGNIGATTGGNIALAAAAWDRLMAPTLQQVSSNADINIAFTDLSGKGENIAGFYHFAPLNGVVTPTAGDVWLDYHLENTNFGRGSFNFLLSMEEVGHALGLKHPFEDYQGSPVLPLEYENYRYTILSNTAETDRYYTQIVTGADGSLQASHVSIYPSTPMVFDIAAIQARYGADTATGAGDSTYTFDQNTPSMGTIYDAGGNDTIDLSTHTRGSIIDLTPGAYSSLDHFSLEDQKAAALAAHPDAASLINSAFDATTTFTWTNNTGIAFSTVIENVRAGSAADSVLGNDANNNISAGGGDDTVFGGVGDDTLDGGDGKDYLRGDDGADSITGGADFDDMNGNKGNDTLHGGEGGDWVVGGQDQDQLYGDNGNDVVYGNLGNDTVVGGDGDDWVRGGQGDDVVDGGAGNDLIWGDRGDDTLTGGAGADMFHTFAGAGVDKVTDFNGADGDRVVIDDHTGYTLAASGADTVVTLATGDTVVLQGVALAGFHADWVSQAA